MLRLTLIPAIVGILFVGRVYWLRLQLDAAGGQTSGMTPILRCSPFAVR
jgi:hypothetical protein